MELAPEIKGELIAEWQGSGHGDKRRVTEKWARLLNCTVNTVYRIIPMECKSDRKNRTGKERIEGIADYAMIVARMKRKVPSGKRLIATEDAIREAVNNNLIPSEMLNVPVSTFNTRMRKMGLSKCTKPSVRYQAEYPNQLHHIDASHSDCFYVKKNLPNGDAILRLDYRPYKGYKNKPKDPEEGNRLWVYGLTDDYSGLRVSRYVAAKGEGFSDNMDFLSWTWSQIGLPDWLKSDHGPMMKHKASRDFFDRLKINIDPSKPLNSRSHGKIERPWRDLWHRFETPFYIESKPFEITLSELNRRLVNYLEACNNKRHRYERTVSRLNMWRRINLQGGIVKMPENAIATTATRHTRTIGIDGCFSLHGERYEVKGLHDAKVWVLEGVMDGRLVVVDKQTGQKYEVETFKPLPYQTYRAIKETPDQKATREAMDLKVMDGQGRKQDLKRTLYMESEDKGNVADFPIRVKETRSVEDILDANVYPSVAAALKDFIAVSGMFLDTKAQALVKEQIINNGLNKTFVRDFALEVQAENERSVKHG